MFSAPDVVIVGGGIAGGALATVLARRGVSIVVLEKTEQHADRVRGEFVVPWGVAEALALGLLDDLVQAGAHTTTRAVPYGEHVTYATAQARSIDLSALVPGVGGALNIGHPVACNALNAAAVKAGAIVLRGVSRLAVTAGKRPSIKFEHDGVGHEFAPRLVIGADGRGSEVARQVRANYSSDPVRHSLTGMLVDGLDDWPAAEQSIGVAGDICFCVFPQGNGRARLYAATGLDQKGRFRGPDGPSAFLHAFGCEPLSHARSFWSARAAGPCHGYPNNDVWLDDFVFEGVVLIGDAAGLNDPCVGQGISIAFKDVRLVSEALLGNPVWEKGNFTEYVQERRERMRRLRFAGRLVAQLRTDFSPAGKERWRKALERIKADATLGWPQASLQKGPFSVPESAFAEEVWNRLLSSD
jgi:2-polyprenyl-6-methoxyphenol hydroxylase-like FAD-dependent oxidoreductase